MLKFTNYFYWFRGIFHHIMKFLKLNFPRLGGVNKIFSNTGALVEANP